MEMSRAANPTYMAGPPVNSDEVGDLKRRVKKLEEAVAALQAVSCAARTSLELTDFGFVFLPAVMPKTVVFASIIFVLPLSRLPKERQARAFIFLL